MTAIMDEIANIHIDAGLQIDQPIQAEEDSEGEEAEIADTVNQDGFQSSFIGYNTSIPIINQQITTNTDSFPPLEQQDNAIGTDHDYHAERKEVEPGVIADDMRVVHVFEAVKLDEETDELDGLQYGYAIGVYKEGDGDMKTQGVDPQREFKKEGGAIIMDFQVTREGEENGEKEVEETEEDATFSACETVHTEEVDGGEKEEEEIHGKGEYTTYMRFPTGM